MIENYSRIKKKFKTKNWILIKLTAFLEITFQITCLKKTFYYFSFFNDKYESRGTYNGKGVLLLLKPQED